MSIYQIINKEPAVLNAPRSTGNPLPVTGSDISISQLLDIATQFFPDVLPESVLRHYGFEYRPDGKIGRGALFSQDRNLTDEQVAELAEELRQKYGTIPTGEKAAREIKVPRKTGKDSRVSQTVRTVLEAKAIPEGLVPNIERSSAKCAVDRIIKQVLCLQNAAYTSSCVF